ncbi:hypothetical protein BDW22DRAFT_1434034 [Trametopsis cervina]|nr:hypothetical protein BDW22DRAFT_1434034 [Trametopsis cervina]
MAKGKSANPADAYRKAQRKKELKKNKAERSKARDFALVKKDTRDLEEEIEKLEGSTDSDKARLAELKTELEKINKKKEDYVTEHPEHRKLVYKARRHNNDQDSAKDAEPVVHQKRNLFNKRGLPRHPERSIYYDPILNPYGVPPPGMPYAERPLRPDEVDSDHEAVNDSDDDIAMPEGPPPGLVLGEHDELVDSDEDIPMPDDPLPGDGEPTPSLAGLSLPSLSPLPAIPLSGVVTGIPPPPPPPLPTMNSLPPGIPPPVGFVVPTLAPGPPPPGFPHFMNIPPPPPGFAQMPPPPPGFFPRKTQSRGSVQDPLSSIPHQTFQAHRASRIQPHPSLPPKPTAPGVSAAATVSAEPELRNLKKESTAFVPAALRKKKETVGPTSRVNAAPSVEVADDLAPAAAPRPDLMSKLKSQFGATSGFAEPKVPSQPKPKVSQSKDDYEKFLAEMGDVLGNPST